MYNKEEVQAKLMVKYVKVFPIPSIEVYKDAYVEEAFEYVPRDGDVILFGYPKTGSTWLLYMVWLILHRGETLTDVAGIPVVEAARRDVIEAMEQPRFYKYHIPYDRMKINKKAKYIYIHRRPEDILASYFHFLREITGGDFDFETFFEAFVRGDAAYGDYFDHVLSSYRHRNEDHLLMISYEELKKDTRAGILRVAKFIGDEHYQELMKNDESLLKKILEVSSFEYMKKNVKFGGDIENKKVNFFRKGTVGDGKILLSEEQRERLKNKMLETMKGTEFVDLWSH